MACNKKESYIQSILIPQVKEQEHVGVAPIKVTTQDLGNKIVVTHSYQEVTAFAITSLSSNVALNQKGSTVSALTLSFELNKVPTSLRIESSAFSTISPTISGTTYSIPLSGLNITSDTTITVYADDGSGEVSRNTTIVFVNSIYRGIMVSPTETTADSVFQTAIVGPDFTTSLQGTRVFSDYNCLSDAVDEYDVFAIPISYGTPVFKFKNNPSPGGAFLLKTVSVTNSDGFTEDFGFYRATYDNLTGQIVSVT